MGLFGKKKEDESSGGQVPPIAPPMPPAPTNVPPSNSSVNDIPKPNAPTGNLSPPSIPGQGLDEIKNQISQANNYQKSSNVEQENNFNKNEGGSKVEQNANNNTNNENNIRKDDAESLFDFSELDIESPLSGIEEDKNTNNQTANALTNQNQSTNNTDDSSQDNEEKEDNDEDLDLSFIKHKKLHQKQDINFVTTKQFKDLLEIIENVKLKVKEASETHLKILDIKSEEDIEFENLRRDFQVIEDKLYQVDSIIFDN